MPTVWDTMTKITHNLSLELVDSMNTDDECLEITMLEVLETPRAAPYFLHTWRPRPNRDALEVGDGSSRPRTNLHQGASEVGGPRLIKI